MLLSLVLCIIVLATRFDVSTCRLLPTLSLISSSPAGPHAHVADTGCEDGVSSASRPETSPGDNLSDKVVFDWKSAGASDDQQESLEDSALPTTPAVSPPQPESVKIFTELGWSEEEAIAALVACNNDVGEASSYLERQDEERDARQSRLVELVKSGWEEHAAYIALESCNGSIASAIEMLVQEQDTVQKNFHLAVKDMVANGWSEVVAREALVSQWNYDRRRAGGENVTLSEAELERIQPTLRRHQHQQQGQAPADRPGSTSPSTKQATSSSPSTPTPSATATDPDPATDHDPVPAKREDVVFEVTADSFQRVVLESPVPVLVDVYADWCGPCKQLGPQLEAAAVKAGGLFRLAKVNSDQQQAVAEALGVTGLPTVYSVVQGKLTDRFVGMLPAEQLQQFLVRAVTGMGRRVQEKEVSEQELRESGVKISNLAGLSSVNFRKREQLRALVDRAMQEPGAFSENGRTALSPAVRAALARINECRADIRNTTLRSVTTRAEDSSATGISAARQLNQAALSLLDAAGFKAPKNATKLDLLELVHSNTAILALVSQRVEEVLNERKFAKMKSLGSFQMPSGASAKSYSRSPGAGGAGSSGGGKSGVGLPASRALETLSKRIAAAPLSSAKEKRETEGADTVAVVLRCAADPLGAKPRTASLPRHTTLRQAVETLLAAEKEGAEFLENVDYAKLEIRFPLPRRSLSRQAAELDSEIEALVGASQSDRSINLYLDNKVSGVVSNQRTAGILGLLASKRKQVRVGTAAPVVRNAAKAKPVRGTGTTQKKAKKAHTLFSAGILHTARKKNNEYFGGDSTVVSAGEEEDEEDAEQ